jgi:polyhydroxyalkanoate synthesis regulator phasin
LKLKEMENTLDEYDERIENLEEEIRELKNQNPK